MTSNSANLVSPRLGLLQEALSRSEFSITPAGPTRWELMIGSTPSTRALLDFDADWVSLSVPCPPADRARPLRMTRLPELLQWNTRLPPPLKFSFDKKGQLEVRADLALTLGPPLAQRIAEACQGLHLAHVIYAEEVPHVSKTQPMDDPSATESSVRLREILEQTGWSSSVRSGASRVELEVEHGAYQARVWEAREQVHVQVELAECEALSPVCLAGLSVLMLTGSRMLRTVRLGFCGTGETLTAVAEVAFQGLPAPEELTAAFQALSTACAQVGAEMAHFENEQIAKEYLRNMTTKRKVTV